MYFQLETMREVHSIASTVNIVALLNVSALESSGREIPHSSAKSRQSKRVSVIVVTCNEESNPNG